MAEVLGVVAGGIGAASFAVQLIDKTQILAGVIRKMRAAPDEATDILIQLNELSVVLINFEQVYANKTLSPGPEIVKVLDDLFGMLQSLIEKAIPVTQKVAAVKSRRQISWTIFKASLKKDQLDELSKRIQYATAILTMAIQIAFQ